MIRYRNMLPALALAFIAFAVGPAAAEEIRAGDLVISRAWSRATPGGAKVAGGFLIVENKGRGDDRLTSASTDVAGKTEVHEMAVSNGVMTMRPLGGGLAIPSGKTVTLAPGGYHIMFMELKQPLKEGNRFNVTLEFKKAGKTVVPFSVESVGAKQQHGGHTAPSSSHSHSSDHGKMTK